MAILPSFTATPSFLDVPGHQIFVEGSDAVVECPAFFGSPPSATMFWQKGANRITTGGRFTPEDGRLRIQNIRVEDGQDTYTCILFYNTTGNAETRTIQVEVVPPSELAPRINDTNRKIEVMYGQPLNLPCPLEEPKDDVSYSWIINTEFERNYEENTQANLHREAHEFLGGIYTCKAENEYGYDMEDFIVKIIGKQKSTDNRNWCADSISYDLIYSSPSFAKYVFPH